MINRIVVGAGYGLTDWIAQRATAVIMAVYSVLMAAVLLVVRPGTFEAWQGVFANGVIKFLTFLFFVSLFSLDVFGTGAPPLEVLVGFLMHNLPSLLMLVLLIIAWKRPVVGFVAFLLAGAAFAVFFVRDIYALPNLLLFVLPILLIASLFYADWQWLEP